MGARAQVINSVVVVVLVVVVVIVVAIVVVIIVWNYVGAPFSSRWSFSFFFQSPQPHFIVPFFVLPIPTKKQTVHG
jgi:hypothetical protein